MIRKHPQIRSAGRSRYAAVVAVVALLTSIAPLQPATAQDGRSLTVSGSGEVTATPDVAVLSVGATLRAPTAQEALTQVNGIVSKLLERAKAMGIRETDLATRQIGVSPVYASRRGDDETPVPIAFQANNTVEIVIRRLDTAGAVIDAMTKAGANSIGGLHFTISDPTPFEDEARRLAVRDAKRRATLIAEEAGVTLGEILTIQENGGFAPPSPKLRTMAMESRTPIAPGETTITAGVSVVFELAE